MAIVAAFSRSSLIEVGPGLVESQERLHSACTLDLATAWTELTLEMCEWSDLSPTHYCDRYVLVRPSSWLVRRCQPCHVC